jgi:hypothetical protein
MIKSYDYGALRLGFTTDGFADDVAEIGGEGNSDKPSM